MDPILLEAETKEILPRVLPSGWRYHPDADDMLYHDKRGILVILNVMQYPDCKPWIHLSLSRRDKKIPTWEDLREVKDLFIGRQRKAIFVLPPEDQYVNLHPGVLHLYCCLGKDPIPDFRYKGTL